MKLDYVKPSMEDVMYACSLHSKIIENMVKDSGLTFFTPMLICDGLDRELKPVIHAYMLAGPFNEHEEKTAAMRSMGRLIYKQLVIPSILMFVSEAWAVTRERYDDSKVEPRNDLNKTEILSFVGLGAGHTSAVVGHMPIVRDDRDIIQPGKFEFPPSDGCKAKLLENVFVGYFEVALKNIGDLLKRTNPMGIKNET